MKPPIYPVAPRPGTCLQRWCHSQPRLHPLPRPTCLTGWSGRLNQHLKGGYTPPSKENRNQGGVQSLLNCLHPINWQSYYWICSCPSIEPPNEHIQSYLPIQCRFRRFDPRNFINSFTFGNWAHCTRPSGVFPSCKPHLEWNIERNSVSLYLGWIRTGFPVHG